MDCKKIWSGDAITVGEEQVVTIGLLNGAIEDFTFAKAIVLMPDMMGFDVARVSEPFDYGGRSRVGSIVSDQNLEITFCLHLVANQYKPELVRGIECRDDHADSRFRRYCHAVSIR
ncbi:MAG: hypothetical protein Rhob2KO_05370 [Rhodopirellula baltica]